MRRNSRPKNQPLFRMKKLHGSIFMPLHVYYCIVGLWFCVSTENHHILASTEALAAFSIQQRLLHHPSPSARIVAWSPHGLYRSGSGGVAAATIGVDDGMHPKQKTEKSELFSNTRPSSRNGGMASVSEWHKQRRREILAKYGDQIAPLERESSSQAIGIPLLIFTCGSLWTLALVCASLPLWGVFLLSVFPGSVLSLWQLQILHDVIHGSFFAKGQSKIWGISRKTLQEQTLFWGSLPCIFGYYLYLKAGHLSHHNKTGEHSLANVFDSDQYDFEDGDVLFVAHRMKLAGDYGPKISLPGGHEFKMSISRSGFYFWKEGEAVLNGIRFAASFLYERILLALNDIFVALLGKNLFFLNKPQSFQDDCSRYARVATALRMGLWLALGWKPLLFLYLNQDDGGCIPTSSTYSGAWYNAFTLNTNLHCEHHDFPTIPFHKLQELRKIAPEYYRNGNDDNLYKIMTKAFAHPDCYACMDANRLASTCSHRSEDMQVTTTASTL